MLLTAAVREPTLLFVTEMGHSHSERLKTLQVLLCIVQGKRDPVAHTSASELKENTCEMQHVACCCTVLENEFAIELKDVKNRFTVET